MNNKQDEPAIELQTVRMSVNVETYQTLFSDAIQVEANDRNVKLHFLQKLPGDPPEDQPNAKLLSSIALTWPHFNNLVEICKITSEENKGSAIEKLIASFSDKPE